MSNPRVQKKLQCFCARKPLLAVYGVDHEGQLFIHIKIWKQDRIYGEIVCTGGVTKIRCRECLRWHRIRVVQPDVMALQEDEEPAELAPDPPPVLLADDVPDPLR